MRACDGLINKYSITSEPNEVDLAGVRFRSQRTISAVK